MLIRSEESVLIVIDMQERLLPAMQAPALTVKNTRTLLAAADEMQVPVLVTEQNPKGLGATVEPIRSAASQATFIEKMHFSCLEEPDFAHAFESLDRKQAVLAGMEAHICVVQTAASLIERGLEVFVVSDATASRRRESEDACLTRLGAAGAGIVTTEMVVFEWLGRAGTPAFTRVLKLIK